MNILYASLTLSIASCRSATLRIPLDYDMLLDNRTVLATRGVVATHPPLATSPILAIISHPVKSMRSLWSLRCGRSGW